METAQNEVTPRQALAVLDAATLPTNAGKLNRQDYVNVEHALRVFESLVVAHEKAEKSEAKKPKPAA